jgi:short-subunit dehydrogenase
MKKSPLFENVTIITGASLGIGSGLALKLADMGAQLALAARDVKKLEDVAAQCRQRGAKAIAVPTDITKQAQCADLIEHTLKEYGRIDTLINNAGLTMYARFDEIKDLTIFEQIMQVNYLGSVYCTYYALPHLKATKGRIVGISSLLGKTGAPTRIGYSASKHALVGFYDSLRIECARDGVSVTVVFPGFVMTGMRERALGADARPLGKRPSSETGLMPVDKCTQMTVKAITQRKRELVMTMRGKMGQWLKLIMPGLVDNIARRAIEEGR